MKRLFLGALLLLLLGLGGLFWFAWPYLMDQARANLEREISQVMGSPSRIGDLSITLIPVRVRLTRIALGTPSMAEVGRIEARLSLFTSLAQWRPVFSLRVESAVVDLTTRHPRQPTAASEADAGMRRLPPFHLENLELDEGQLRFRMGDTPATLRVEHLGAHARVGLVRRHLVAGIEANGLELRRKSYRVRLSSLRAEGGTDAGGLFVDSASLVGQRITATVRATSTAHRHAVEARFDPGVLGIVVDELSSIGGVARAEGTLIGSLADPVFDGRLRIARGAIGSHILGDLDTHVIRKGATLHFDDLALVETAGRVTGSVELTVLHEVPIRGALTWDAVDLERMMSIIGQPVPFTTRFDATTTVRGALDPLDLDVQGSGALLAATATAARQEVGAFVLSGRVHPHDLDATLTVTQPQQNRVTAHVSLQGPQFGGGADVRAGDLAALNVLVPRSLRLPDLAGRGQASVEFSGTTDSPVVGGDVDLQEVTVAGNRLPRLGGGFSLGGGALRTSGVRLEGASGFAELNGVIALDDATGNDWRLRLQDIDTELVFGLARTFSTRQMPLRGGTLSGRVACHGVWPRAEAQGDLTATALRLWDEPVQRVDVQAATTLPRWTAQVAVTHRADETVTVDAAGKALTDFRLTLKSTAFDLANLRGASHRRITGTLLAEGQLSGTPLAPSGSLHLTGAGLGAQGHLLGDVALQANGRAGEWTLQGRALADAVRIDATVSQNEPLPYTMAATWRDADLSRLVSGDASLRIATSGALTLGGTLRAPEQPTGSLRVTRFEIARDEGQVSAPEPIEIELNRGHFRIGSLQLASRDSRLIVSGDGGLSGDLSVVAKGDGDLVLLELIGRPFESARGQFGVDVQVRHSLAAGWTVRGTAFLRDAALDLGLPVTFIDTNGSFRLRGNGLYIERLAGRVGGGEFTVGGRVHLKRGPALTWTLREVAMTLPTWLEERISGTGRVRGTWRAMTVSGDLEVLGALYDQKLELSALLPWFTEHLAPPRDIGEPPVVVTLDLKVHAPDGLYVDNNFAKAEMAADLHITGDATAPRLGGKIEVLNGEVTFRGRVFTITGGSLNFENRQPINPILNITAESQISTPEADYTIRVAVSGTADNPRAQFSSDDPSLSQNDVLSLATFGKTVGQAQQESGGVSVGDVLALLPGEYEQDVRQQVRNVFGVDRLEVEPAYVRNTGTIEPRVTIGKDLTERLRALASSSFGTEARNSVQLEYRVTGRVSLLSTWESASESQAGAFGGDVKFRYEFRKLPFSLLTFDRDVAAQGDAP